MAVQPSGGPPGIRPGRAELLAALSLAIDLGLGQPMEHMLRSSLIATSLADRLGLGEQQRAWSTTPTWWRGSAATPTRTKSLTGSATTSRSEPTSTGSTGPGCRCWACCEHVGRGRPLLARG